MRKITYANGDGKDSFSQWMQVIRLSDGLRIENVREANATDGWFVIELLNVDGTLRVEGDEIATARIEEPIRIEWRPDTPESTIAAYEAAHA